MSMSNDKLNTYMNTYCIAGGFELLLKITWLAFRPLLVTFNVHIQTQ